MSMVKFSPTAINFGYDFLLLVHFLEHPEEDSLCTLENIWSIIMMETRMAIIVVVVVKRIVLMMMMMMIEGGLCDVVGNIRGMFHGECLTILRQPMISIAGRICDYATKQSDTYQMFFTCANDNNGAKTERECFGWECL